MEGPLSLSILKENNGLNFLDDQGEKVTLSIHRVSSRKSTTTINGVAEIGDQIKKPKKVYIKANNHSCLFCGKFYNSFVSLEIHYRVHTRETPFRCKICHKWLRYKPQLKTHQQMHKGGEYANPCTICDKKFINSQSLRRHMFVVHCSGPRQRFECTICHETFSQDYYVGIHVKKVHLGQIKPKKCEFCLKLFGDMGKLNIHMRTHTREKPYKCTLCKKSFSHDTVLKGHLRSHTGERPYVCTDCPKKYSSLRSLKHHVNTLHSNIQPKKYRCELCVKIFSLISSLRRHKKKFHSAAKKSHRCAFCSKSFWDFYALRCHMPIHTGEKPYNCTICQEWFATTNSLARHKRLHTDK